MNHQAIKLWGAMTIFVVAGAFGSSFAVSSPFFIPEILFYLMLLVHTYLSISLFSRIETKSPDQYLIDALLMISYILLALSLGSPIAFFFFNLCLFIFAPIKYAFLLGRIGHEKLLYRKILVDLSGTVLAAGVLGSALLGSALLAAWTLAILFALASVRYLYTHPLYKLQQ